MKKTPSKVAERLFVLLLLLGIVSGCRQTNSFDITKVGLENKQAAIAYGQFQLITRYDVNFAPSGKGIINFTSECGAKFKADKLDGATLQALISLLNTPKMRYDTMRNEFTLNLHDPKP